jgi:hypothetical protein
VNSYTTIRIVTVIHYFFLLVSSAHHSRKKKTSTSTFCQIIMMVIAMTKHCPVGLYIYLKLQHAGNTKEKKNYREQWALTVNGQCTVTRRTKYVLIDYCFVCWNFVSQYIVTCKKISRDCAVTQSHGDGKFFVGILNHIDTYLICIDF